MDEKKKEIRSRKNMEMGAETVVKKTTCGVCGAGCQVDACVQDGKMISIEGSQCAKGAAAVQFLYNKERVRFPMKQVGKKGEGHFERISWEEAYEMIAKNLQKVKEAYGAKSTVFYAGYPKWFRPALLRFANAYGSPNFCTESSTCFQASALAWRLMYGNEICGPDLQEARTLLLWSSNLYHSNTPSAGMYRMLREKGVNLIAVDPRHTVTAHDATQHLQLIPGTDGALALSMAQVIIEEDLYDHAFVEKYVHGFEAYKEYVKTFPPARAEAVTGVKQEQIRLAARTFATQKPSAILFSASTVVHHINGVNNYRAVFALLALTGNYDVPGGNRTRPGMVSPCNEFGQIRRFDGEEAIGEKDFPVWFELPCQEAQCTRLAQYIESEKPYPVKAIFAMGLNHRMWPQPQKLNKALGKLDFYVNTELFFSESSKMADLLLPACTTFEREEVHVLRNGRFCFSEKAVEPLGEAKNDIEIIMEVMQCMGLCDGVMEKGYEAYMEHILAPSGLTLSELKTNKEGMQGRVSSPPAIRTYETKPFHTPSGRIELESLVLEKYAETYGCDALPVYHDYREETDVDREQFPLLLSTGCRKPQLFHSRLYRVPWLASLEKTPLVELHKKDGETYHIADGKKVRIISPAGMITGVAAYNENGKPGVVYLYHGNEKGDANELIDREYLDPVSGFPGFRSYFCRIEAVEEEE